MQDTELLQSEKTHFLLPNFPQELIVLGKEIWADLKEIDVAGPKSHKSSNMEQLPNTNKYFVRRASPTFIQYKFLGDLRQRFIFIPEAQSVEFYVGLPEKYVADPHIDRGDRTSAINIPIDVIYDESFFMIGKFFDFNKYRERPLEDSPYQFQISNIEDKGRKFYYDKDLFDHYNMETPVLFSTKTPHGGRSWSKTMRVIMSIGFCKPVDIVQRKLPKEWF